MNSSFYAKLAATNIKKNSKTYIPYILTCILTTMMYFIMHSISINSGLDTMYGGDQLKMILNLGKYIIAIFSIIFLFYTNSFLIKRRKKEFGLFNILGMEKKHIAKIMFFETLYVSLISILAGLLGGILINKLMFLSLLKILDFKVTMGFEISIPAIITTITLFSIIFILTLLNTLRQIHISEPIELIKGGNVGEKEPKCKWIITIIGLLALILGYYISITTKSPLDAMSVFFLAVIFVIIGTYCLFTSGSITLLKVLRKNKKYYYKANHFISLSGMIYRMKQNAVGLANICVLSTMVLVMLSSTVSLFIGSEDIINSQFPKEIAISQKNYTENSIKEIKNIANGIVESHNVKSEKPWSYRYLNLFCNLSGNKLTPKLEDSDKNLSYFKDVFFLPLEDYNKSMNTNITLDENEVLVYSLNEPIEGDTISIYDKDFKIKEKHKNFELKTSRTMTIFSNHYIVVNNMSIIDDIYNSQLASAKVDDITSSLTFNLGFDLDNNKSQTIDIYNEIKDNLTKQYPDIEIQCRTFERGTFYSIYGGLFFLGIFLGILFIIATIIIIYYKQISEGYDDKERFNIMQKVGLSPTEIKSTIRSQVLTVFFLPLIIAVIHVAFAFPFITRLLAILNLTDVKLFAICTLITIGLFGICYLILYSVTAKIYYKIVYSK